MSNPLPVHLAPAQRGSAPNPIEPELYKGLADLRQHCSRDGVALIDRVYRDALALHKRALDAEAELELYAGPRVVTDAFPPQDVFGNPRTPTAPKVQLVRDGEDLL